VSEDGKLGEASVLGLDGAEAVEAGLVRSPRGSQNPRGASAPISDSKAIFKAEDLEATRAGEKAATLTIEAMMVMNLNMVVVRVFNGCWPIWRFKTLKSNFIP
jgi:hypothetical protein